MRVIELIIQGVGLFGLAFAAIKFAIDRAAEKEIRSSELRWRKTEFLLQLAKEFDQSDTYRQVARALESPQVQLYPICTTPFDNLTDEQKQLYMAFDRYMDFFDRIYDFVFVTEVLSVEETVGFSGHIDTISDDETIRTFATGRGYSGVVLLSRAFDAYLREWKSSDTLRSLVPDADSVAAADAP